MSQTIKQTVTFRATPKEVYEAFMDSKKHAKFIGDSAKIEKRVGGKFSIYGGSIEGQNLALEAGKRIVQAWRYEDWPKGHYSVLILDLAKVGKGTKMTVTQISVPDDKAKDIGQGWTDYYWNPMKAMLEKK